jgi:beta-glucosidase
MAELETTNTIQTRVDALLSRMTLAEKIGQMSQFHAGSSDLRQAVRDGRTGAVINLADADMVNDLQRLAVEESRLGIPLLIGRDVIHGFKTIFPIPLAQAASWNPDVMSACARIAATEAASSGINWTFSPMVDITRDPRWGRIAECLGEDPYLCQSMALAMVDGYQGDTLSAPASIAACAKHFAGYGASEGGRDYNTLNIPEVELRNTHLPPFKALADAGVASFMTAFSELNGIPASGHGFLLKQVLRQEWGYRGLVVSDWESIPQMTTHGFTDGDREAALAAFRAGVDMEMASTTFSRYLGSLLEAGEISMAQMDVAVARILCLKFELGLFDNPYTKPANYPALGNPKHMQAARCAAVQSCVLLQNRQQLLPLSKEQLRSVAIVGPLADAANEQMGTWVFDGEPTLSETPLQALRAELASNCEVHYNQGLEHTRSRISNGFAGALECARKSDVVIMFVGEDAILSGEAHCRANIDLPGHQQALIEAVSAAGKPVVLVIMAGRPLALEQVVNKVDAVLYAWHPGSMAGPAIADLLLGRAVPSGKLPVTFPRMVGQVPIYYAQKNTGKPAGPESWVHIDDIAAGAPQTSFGMSSMYLDAGYTPLFPFGFGLSYSSFEYRNIRASTDPIRMGGIITISAEVKNTGKYTAEEVVQLYIRDLVGSITRPVKELKGFRKVRLEKGQQVTVDFEINTDNLAFYDSGMRYAAEPGTFNAWIGGCSDTDLRTEFSVID